MKIPRAFLPPVIAFTVCLLALPARADDPDNPEMNQARDDIEQALDAGGDAPMDPGQQKKLLHDALDLLKDGPVDYRRKRLRVMDAIKSALFELDKGDQDKANGYIHDADELIRDIT